MYVTADDSTSIHFSTPSRQRKPCRVAGATRPGCGEERHQADGRGAEVHPRQGRGAPGPESGERLGISAFFRRMFGGFRSWRFSPWKKWDDLGVPPLCHFRKPLSLSIYIYINIEYMVNIW